MNNPVSVMGIPDFSVDPYRDLIRTIIEARAAYERLCGLAPMFIYVNGPIRLALIKKGFQERGEIAGMKIIMSPESVADMAICSRDEHLFEPVQAVRLPRGKAKK